MFYVYGSSVLLESREKAISSSVITPNRHVQLRYPDNSTNARDPRGNYAARGSTWTDFLV